MRHTWSLWAASIVLTLLVVHNVQRADSLKMEDLTEEQKAEAMRQRDMLTDMLGQLEGLTDEETKTKISEFTPQQRELLKAYYEHKHKQAQDTTQANARLTPEQQQEMLKELFDQLEDKSYGEQEAIKKKWTAQQKDLFERYQAYQKKMQEEYAEKRAKEMGHCEISEMYPHTTPDGDTDWEKPVMGRCRRVHIWDENLGDAGARALANEILAHPNLFAALSLDTTEIGEEGGAHLARMLKDTSSLEVLDVDSNSVGNAGAKALADAAKAHPTLHTLGLAHNEITDDGAKALVELLRSNYKIVALPLQGNDISASVLKSIEDLLEKNRALAEEQAEAARNASAAAGAGDQTGGVPLMDEEEEEETVVIDDERSDL